MFPELVNFAGNEPEDEEEQYTDEDENWLDDDGEEFCWPADDERGYDLDP